MCFPSELLYQSLTEDLDFTESMHFFIFLVMKNDDSLKVFLADHRSIISRMIQIEDQWKQRAAVLDQFVALIMDIPSIILGNPNWSIRSNEFLNYI